MNSLNKDDMNCGNTNLNEDVIAAVYLQFKQLQIK